MSLVLATVVGGLFAVGTYLVLRRDLVRVVWGVVVLTQSANVYLIAMGGVRSGTHDLVPVLEGHGGEAAGTAAGTADPVVQALVLTAIVIGFGTTAFALVLSYRAYEENESMDVREWASGSGRE